MCTTGKPSASPGASATGRPDRDPLATQDDPAKCLTQDSRTTGDGSARSTVEVVAEELGQAGLTVQASWRRHCSLIDTSFSPGLGPHRGHTRPDHQDNSGQRRPVVVPGQPPCSGDDAGRPATPVLSRTEEATGPNPLTSTTSTDVNPPRMLGLLGAPHGG
jgi:hypothetical protein